MLMEGIEENSSCFSLCVQACKDGSLEDLKDALSKCDNQKINPFKERSPRGSLFHIASMNRECPLEILEELITVFRKLSKKSSKKGSGLIAFLRDSLTPEEGYTALHCACKYNKLNYVYVFVKELRFYGIGHTAVSRHTPFEVCCQFKCQRVASFILQNCKGLYDDFSNGLVIAFGNGSVSHKEFIKEVCKVHKVTTQTLDSLCRKKLFNIVKFCIEEKLCKQEGKQLMQMAVSQGQTNLMKYHLHVDNYHEIYTVPDKSGNNLMHIACSEHQLDSIHCLIASGYAEMALAKNKNRETPFDIAVYKHFEDITLLFEKELKLTPLHLYCLRDPAISEEKEIIEVLKTIIASTVQDAYLNSALRYACQNAHLFIVNNLLLVFESEIDLSEPNSNGDTPVHLLVQQLCLISKKIKANEESNEALKKRSRKKRLQRQEEKIVFLLSVMMEHETFDPTILNAQNESAVFIFLTKLSYETFSYYDILRAFLKQAVTKYHKTNALSKDILNMVHHYCRYIYYVPKKGSGEYDINSGRFINFVQTLSSENNNFNPNEVDSEGNACLHYAACNLCIPLVEYFLTFSDLSINKVNYLNKSPLQSMQLSYKISKLVVFCKIYSLLMDKGASVDNIHLPIDTKEGNTLLHLACIAKSSFLLKSLTSRASIESMVNKQNKKGKAPIHLLCSNARKFVSVECFRILLNLPGIDVNLPNRSGNTPLSILTSHINSRRPIMYEGIKESILLLTEHSSFKPELYLTSDYLQIWCQVDKEDLFRQIFEIDKHRYLLNFVNYFSQNLLHIACLNFSSHVILFLTMCSNSSVLFLQKDYFENTPLASLCWRVFSPAKSFVSYQEDIVLQSLDFLIKHESITCIIDELEILLYCLHTLSSFSIKWLAEKMIVVLLNVVIVNDNGIRNCLASVPFDSLLAEFKYKETTEPVLKDILTIANCTPVQSLLSKSIYQRKGLLFFCLNGNSLLHLACKLLNKDAVSTLISESIVLPEEVNDDGQTCLHVMIEEQNISYSSTPSKCFFEIFDLLKSKNLFHVEDVNGNTCLHLACNNKALSTLIREIVYANPRLVTIKNNEGNTPLHIACNSGQLEAIDILLQQKHINLRSVNAKQQTVFHISICKKKIIDLLKTHLSYQDNILCMRDADNCTCLHLAYEIHSNVFLTSLVPPCTILDMSLIADIVNIKNSKGQTMLHICPELILNTKITKLDVAAVDNDGDTPLLNFMIMLCLANNSDSNFFFKESLLPDYDQCSPNCHSEMWEQVIKIPTFEMSINHKSNHQFTLLHLACTHFNEDLILKEKIINSILCFPNCKTNIVNKGHSTPFHILAKLNPRMFDKFCKNKTIDLNVVDTNGNTPLHVLRYSQYAAFLDLVNNDDNSSNSYGLANLFISNIAGNTALHTACMYNCAYYVHIFSKLMSNVNIQNKNGETPFHCLYKSSDDEATDKAALLFNKCWEILVNHVSFDPNIQDACGMTILHYECQKSKPDFVLVKRLLSLNATNTKLRNNQNQTCILVAEASSCKEKSYLLSLLKTHRSDNDFLAFSHLMSPYHGLYDFHKRCNCCLMLHAMSLNNEKCKDALYLACEAVCPESISKLLLRCRNKLICNYIKQQSGQTPLHSLALGLKKQADFIIQGYSDNLLKLRQKDLSFVRGKVNILSKHDWRILLQCGINKQDDLGNTALHYVCEAQNVTMLRVLTSDSSCRFDIRNNAEKLPITIAYESGNRSFYLRFLIKYFRSQGDEGFADYYKTVLKDGATISMTPVKCILTGPPGAGKTTLKQRLLGEKLASTISTGVSDSPQVIAVRNISHEQVSLPSSEMKWTPVDIRDQIEALLETVSLHAHNAIKETLGRPPVLPPSTRYGISKNAKSSKDTNYNDTGNSSKKFKSGFNEWHEKQGKGKPKKFKSIEKQLKELRILANSVPSKKSKSDQHKFTIRELEKNPFVRVIDTGGQPELHELLPAFVNGPAINLIVFDLQIPLQDQIPIYCRSEDEGDSVVYSSCINHEDMILRSLSSIACLGYGQQMNFNEDGVSHSSTYPAAFLIGSHKDMVKEEVIKLVNEHLMSLIKTCDLDVHEIIQRYENCLFYPINGLDESSKEIDKLRQEIFNATKQFKSVEVPMTWLILSIKLQVLYEKKEINCVIDIEKCFKIANIECGFKSIDEMKNALWFYHYVMGTIMYFPYIPELNEKVILDLQAIFDCVTKLINCCFVYGTVSERTEEEFTKFGTFFVRHLEKVLNSKDNKSKYPFSAREIIALLKHLHAIVAIDDDKYFMPTALKPVLLSEAHQDATSCPPPLLISFACGYTPVGIFGSLITHLLSNAKHNIECKLADDTRQYRNKIVLSCGSYHADLILMAWSRFIEINFKRKGDLHESIADVCQKVRLAIDESIEVISKSFNYKCKAKHSFGFPCNNLACNSLPVHPAICKVAIRSAECVQKNNLIELSDSQLIWFGIQQEQVVENGLMEDSLSEEIFQKTLEIDDLDDVFEKLDDLNEWKKLGLKLGLKYPTLERIEKDKRVIDDCKMEMLACWLKKQDKVKSPSWKQLIIVLCKMKETEISKKIIEELRI